MKAKLVTYFSKQFPCIHCKIERPIYPRHLDVIFKSKKGSRKFYDTFNISQSTESNPLAETIWANIIQNENLQIDNKEIWNNIYQICFYSVRDNNVIWFQYRILNKILGSKDYLKKLKITTDNMCSFCGKYEENIDHLFNKCKEVTSLWTNIERWIKNKLGVNITLTTPMKILGYLIRDENFWPLNLVLIVTRRYIFWCSKNNFHLNIYFLQKEVRKTYDEQEALSKMNLQFDTFNRKWVFWKNLFIGI